MVGDNATKTKYVANKGPKDLIFENKGCNPYFGKTRVTEPLNRRGISKQGFITFVFKGYSLFLRVTRR